MINNIVQAAQDNDAKIDEMRDEMINLNKY